MNLHTTELNWIHGLQSFLRNSFTDTFFIYWDYVDSIWFVMLFVATIMYLFNRKEGVSILFLFIISGVLNILLKNWLQMPRPCQIDPSVGLLCYKSYGMPSGAAQTATIIAGFFCAKCQKSIYKILGVLFALFLCFSRIYLGLHFFTDILGGITVGIGLLFIYHKLFPHLGERWDKLAFALTALFLLIGGTRTLTQTTMALGTGIGLLLGKKMHLPSSWLRRLLTYLIVIVGSAFLLSLGGVHTGTKLVTALLASFWFVYLGSFLVECLTGYSSN